jgi:hypothetical protein
MHMINGCNVVICLPVGRWRQQYAIAKHTVTVVAPRYSKADNKTDLSWALKYLDQVEGCPIRHTDQAGCAEDQGFKKRRHTVKMTARKTTSCVENGCAC